MDVWMDDVRISSLFYRILSRNGGAALLPHETLECREIPYILAGPQTPLAGPQTPLAGTQTPLRRTRWTSLNVCLEHFVSWA